MKAILAQLLIVTCLHGEDGDSCNVYRIPTPMPLAYCELLETETADDRGYAQSVCELIGKNA